MERDFKGVWIPKEIWLDKRLTALEKVIFLEIDSLDNEETHCYASNKHLAEFCQCTEVKISTAINKLIKLGFLELVSFDGRTRILKSRLKETLRQNQTNFKAESNKVNTNNTFNNTESNKKETVSKDTEKKEPLQCNRGVTERFRKPTLDEIKAYCLERGNNINAEQFYDYYESKGWLVGKSPMKDWKASVRTWERNGYGASQTKTDRQKVAHDTGYMKGIQRDANGDIIF